jgi:hypothetical protein
VNSATGCHLRHKCLARRAELASVSVVAVKRISP